MHPDILSILAEPVTGAPLTLTVTKEREGRIETGALISTRTGKRFPIVRGIPRFVSDQGYTSNFGRQWNLFKDVQLDSQNRLSASKARFDTETGFTPEKIAGKLVLDVGCGAGRFAEIAAQYGALVVGIDFSSAVEAARETLDPYRNAVVIQASVYELPFKPGSFPFAYSIGVMQHTPNPPEAVRCVVSSVAVGGAFALSIYARQPWTKLNAKYLVRPITRRLPETTLLNAIEKTMPVLFPLTDVLYRIPGLGKLARFTIPVANYVERKDQPRDLRYKEALLDTFDMLSPRYDQPMTADEVENAIRDAGPSAIHFRSRVPVVVNGTRQ